MEQHLLIDWCAFFSPEDVRTYISQQHSLHCDKVLHMPAMENPGDTLQSFYGAQVGDNRGRLPFVMYLLQDSNPMYKLRSTTKGHRLVNVNVFDLKQSLRKASGQGFLCIHGTDNIQETKDNLRALGLYLSCYKEKSFSDIRAVFDALNADKALKYVVMRNFEGLPDHITLDNHLDVDILCNDYYRAKRILDGDNKQKHQYEDGGHRILNHVNIAGKSIMFDLRYIGDNYYDEHLQQHMLDSRILLHNFYIPDEETHIHSLIYHALIHKPKISKTYKDVLHKYGISYEVKHLRDILHRYMQKYNFAFVKPKDSTVGFFHARHTLSI